MSEFDDSGNNYTYYNANIILPRVKSFPSPTHQSYTTTSKDNVSGFEHLEFADTVNNDNLYKNKDHDTSGSNYINEKPAYDPSVADSNSITSTTFSDDKNPLFIPCPPSQPKPQDKITRAQIHTKSNDTPTKRLLLVDQIDQEKHRGERSKSATYEEIPQYIKIRTQKEQNTSHKLANSKVSRDQKLIDRYKDFLNQRFNDNSSDSDDEDISITVSSLSSDNENEDNDSKDDECIASKTLTATSFAPLYSLPHKIKNNDNVFNKILISNSNVPGKESRSGSLPDLRSIKQVSLKKVSHVTKNESEAESEPGATIGYKFKPLPPIPGTTSNINNSGLYETIDGLSKLQKNIERVDSLDSNRRKTFKDIATILTLVPRLTTNSVRSRKSDDRLADISQYLPDKKLKIFVGTWNMKGTKFLPSSLDDFLLPPESIYLQDVYVIGTQEGTPFRREWQLRLQETFGPSHVLMQASNFGVLQLSIFVRRELVWFCSSIEQDTIATRVGHKIKTKGALAMSFSIFGTSLLFLTSHFTSDKEKLRDRINDYKTICRNIQLPYNNSKTDEVDVTDRFDRVFWFGDFNFRIKKTREVVDRMLKKYSISHDIIIRDLLPHDQLNELFQKGKIFHGFTESRINFMPTYKFDVNTETYDSSSKQRVPSWTDRIVHKSSERDSLVCMHYNSCNTIKVSDHRPVYGIFEALVEPYKNNFAVGTGATFNREVYVEANLRRNAPPGSQSNSHVCTIL